MVRETRHLWVGNLPDNIREDRIREHFKRYGRVQNVKLLGRMESANPSTTGSTNSGVCATVAFMDIKSASKAHNVEHVLDERTLTTEYYEPAAIPSSAGAPSAGSSPAGSGYSGSSSSVNSTPAPASTTRYHLSGEESAGNACAMAASAAAPATWRGTNDSATDFCRRGNTPAAYGRYQRNNSTAPYATSPSNVERTTPHHRWYAGAAGGAVGAAAAAGAESAPSTPGGGTERRRRLSGSGSSRSESSSPEPSDTSRASTPAAHHSHHHTARRTPPPLTHQWPSTANGRPLAICVRNLPTRSTDSSLKDGLYHEYKKHGKVVWVKVVGQNADRYAVVRFKKPSDVEKALEVSQDKLFFGCKISVAPHQSCDDDAESAKPYETDIDEYHPKATRTLFIGNLEKDVTQQQLRDKFKHFGRIIEIDIKKGSGGGAGYAFCQYASISSVVEAIRAMDGEHVGSSRVKLGFGKPVATTCVWVDGLTEHTEKQVLGAVSRCGAATSVCVDRAAGAALVHFEQAAAAGGAVRELRRVAAALSAAEPDHPRLCVDYASRECQDAFYEQLEKHGGTLPTPAPAPPSAASAAAAASLRYEAGATRSRAPSFGRASSRTPRYNTHDHYDPTDYAADRRYRVYDELGSSPQTDEANYEDRLQSVVVSPHRAHKHRRDSSPEERKHSKERHRSAGGQSGVSRRSRSGSRGHASRRRHRKRGGRDGSGTPLRDEPDAPPAEPRRPPRERPPLPMSLPLPKFAVQLLRAAPAPARAPPPAPAAPASPPRPPSASSSSAGSAPHSPSLEERIRSLDEKYERWTVGGRAAPDRARLRHRLLELDVNEVKPSDVVLSLLAKRSVFDEDSERLEGARVPSPGGSPRSRILRYPFNAVGASQPPEPEDLERSRLEKLIKIDLDNESRPRRTSSIDKSLDIVEKKLSPGLERCDFEEHMNKRRNSLLITDEKPLLNDLKPGSDRCLETNISLDTPEKTPNTLIRDVRNISEDKMIIKKEDIEDKLTIKTNCSIISKHERNCFREDIKLRNEDSKDSKLIKQELQLNLPLSSSEKYFFKNEFDMKSESIIQEDIKLQLEQESKLHESSIRMKNESERCQNNITKETLSYKIHNSNHLNAISCIESSKKNSDVPNNQETKYQKNCKEKSEIGTQLTQKEDKSGKENVDCDKSVDKTKLVNNILFSPDRITTDIDRSQEDHTKSDKEKSKHTRERIEKDMEKSKSKNFKLERNEKERKGKEEALNNKPHSEKGDKLKSEKDPEKERDVDKTKHDEKHGRHENHKKDKIEKERKRELSEVDILTKSIKKDDKHKHDRTKKDNDSKRDSKKEIDVSKSRKSSRDESSRDICRKDSTDSAASRASHESTASKLRDLDIIETKEEPKSKMKSPDAINKHDQEKEPSKSHDHSKLDGKAKIKSESKDENKDFGESNLKTKIKEEKDPGEHHKSKSENHGDTSLKSKGDGCEKQRHYSLDSPSVDSKRKERLNSCSSLPSHVGHKRRMSSQDSVDYLNEDSKKSKLDRRDSKDARSFERHKTTKFSKGHFAKIIESKTKDDKKNQVKPPDDIFLHTRDNEIKEAPSQEKKNIKKSPPVENEDKTVGSSDASSESLHSNIDFLATLELRSSEEDERQRALRKEMKEKKRIQQLQQIQELQMQQDALNQQEHGNKIKEDRKYKHEDKKKESAREKRMSTDRKSKDERIELSKRRNRKQLQSSDSSDSDEPKKHSIFDIVDDGPTYISMYDKVKARSCKNMQKQEEEKRQEKIKAKFSQLKQSRAKREEKKRSSWDEDSDSENERRKPHKASMDSSTDDDHIVTNSKKREKSHGSSLEYDRSRGNDYFDVMSNEEDSRNKLSRKNSRSRIMSDTSDDENMKRTLGKSPNFMDKIKKEIFSDSESSQKCKDVEIQLKESSDDKIKKTSLLNLFGKSDSDDNRLKPNLETESDYRMTFPKNYHNDISSENESIPPNRNSSEIRKKHKKKQKKYKFSFSDEETKIHESFIQGHDIQSESGSKHKNTEKSRRHSNKKEKRKDRIRDSVDTDEPRDEKNKLKKEKRSPNQSYDGMIEISSNNNKKDGKMEDIFGPLSDESDRDAGSISNKLELAPAEFDSTINISEKIISNCDETKNKDKDDSKRRRDKKRKEKRHYIRDDENSLDVDAVSKAIEARLFADIPNTHDDKTEHGISDCISKSSDNDLKLIDINYKEESLTLMKYNEKVRKDSRDKKKKKKKSKEDRQNRKDHHHHHHNHNCHHEKNQLNEDSYIDNIQLSPKTMLLDIPLPNDIQKVELTDKSDDSKSLSESPNLPESPPFGIKHEENNDSKNNECDTPNRLVVDDAIEIDYDLTENIEVNDIPMPPPIENIVQDISEVPLPTGPPLDTDSSKNILPPYDVEVEVDTDVKISEDAVRSIPSLENETEKQIDKIINDSHGKIDKKVEEKPRAIISQEETEDAVAALLGESFGGKINTFDSCYEEVESNTAHHIEIETTPIESETMPEEDAEEMRQAVQNLNASEMEIKPDTPVSDNDLLLIDTDTEEGEENNQDAIERLPVNIISTNSSLNNNTKVSIPQTTNQTSNIIIAKPKTTIVNTSTKESSNLPKKSIEDEIKALVTKQDNLQQSTSTATPVITSWTLSNNKLIEPQVLNIPVSSVASRDNNDNKPTHITANIVQIKTPQNQNVHINNTPRPVLNSTRPSAPYQVINQIIRPQVSSMQPPTIKIPEPHIIYQKPQGIVISPRMTNEPILLSPKANQQTEGMTSPRLGNMAILNTSQNINSTGMVSPGAIQQRSPGQVTVVRMQQPQLSPIQTMHIPQGARPMVSPNRPNSVLVQTQGTPIHFNRLPVTPVLASIPKLNANIIQQTKGSNHNSPIIHQPKIISSEVRKADSINETAKIILSPNRLQQSPSPTIMAQNRLISMQNSLHVANVNSTLHLSNKVLINNKNSLMDKRENQSVKSEHNHITSLASTPIIHVASASHSSPSIIQGSVKPALLQETSSVNRGHPSNVIHTINSQRLLTTTPVTNVIQLDQNKVPPTSVLSMATIKPHTSLVKPETSNTVVVTTSSLANVVMTPLLLKTSSTPKPTIRLHSRSESENIEHLPATVLGSVQKNHDLKQADKNKEIQNKEVEDKRKSPVQPIPLLETIAKCETDFEELLKDKTNEIKITNHPEKIVEINVGRNVTLINQNHVRRTSLENTKRIEYSGSEKHASEIIAINPLKDNLSEKEEKRLPLLLDTIGQEKTLKENDIDANQQDKTDTEQAIMHKTNQVTNNIENAIKLEVEENKNQFFGFLGNQNTSNEIKNIDENDYWSGIDVNIESVIKKVDSLCKETPDEKKEETSEISIPISNENDKLNIEKMVQNESSVDEHISVNPESSINEFCNEGNDKSETFNDSSVSEESVLERTITTTPSSKRGGRSGRGKKSEKADRVQTRQISKPARGTSKRGRGRVKVDKKIKDYVSSNLNNMPGDVYDFHEDSGDETVNSPNKNEVRPRLILTIKSPLSGHSNSIATSTLSITPKDQCKKEKPKVSEDERFCYVPPSTINTRKSRRLQEKDIQRSTVDDVIDDVIKGSTAQYKNNTENNKKRATRQTGTKINAEKISQCDTRKSPRGAKRTRDRSLSDASVGSSDDNPKREDIVKEPKIMKLVEPVVPVKAEVEIKTTSAPTTVVVPPPNPTPIMKPPKKKILASAFEAAANASNTIRAGAASPNVGDRPAPDAEPGPAPRVDNVPVNMMPVGATEATDARVQSPALPHRPPSAHHPPDRATPILVRGGEGEGGAGASRFRGAYAGPASLPRGAHHPPLSKQVAVVGPQHHPGSRVTITNVPAVSPQGQISMSAELVRSPPPAHQQTSPITSGEGMYPHFSQHHYQMYQQHFRATQFENVPTLTTFPNRGALEAEGSEAPTPPLELRRPPSARVPRPAHSPSPHDRHIMYAVRCGRSPPPAHGTSRGPAALPPPAAPGPPHASQVPREADSLQMLLRRYPVMWQGLLALKNDSAAVQMHFVGGNPNVAADALARNADGTAASLLRIAQRMRLEPAQLDQVHRKMKLENEHCTLLALPCGRDHMDVLQQSTNLTAGFITYLQRKQAAGIVNVAPPGHQQSLYTVHIFPSCDFANENLNRIAPDLMHRVANIAHLLIVIATAIG